VVTSGCLGIARKQIALCGLLAGKFQVGIERIGEVVGIDEIIARIIRRVDVDHLHPAEIGLVQELQDFEVVSFDEDIIRLVEVD